MIYIQRISNYLRNLIYAKLFALPNSMKSIVFFLKDLIQYNRMRTKKNILSDINFYPCIADRTTETLFDRHYTYFPAWAMRKILDYKPKLHIDISSSLHFCTMLSAVIKTEFYDFRPAKIKLSNLITKQADLTNLPFEDNSIKSLSCMHVIEHIGLGRYGDKIDPQGDQSAAKELIRVLSPGGRLLIVVPVGKDVVMFNAHRIYSLKSVKHLFRSLKLVESYLIPEKQGIDPIMNPTSLEISRENYSCGCFMFRKEVSHVR